MSDQNLIETLLNNKLNQVIEQEIVEIVKNKDWINHLETQVVGHVQDRLTAKFNNIASLPEIVNTIKLAIKELFNQGQIPGVETFIDSALIQSVVNQSVQNLVEQTIDNLLIDSAWLSKIQTIVDRRMADRVQAKLAQTDIDSLIDATVATHFGAQIETIKNDMSIEGLVANDVGVNVVTDLLVDKNLLVTGDLVVRGHVNTDNQSWQAIISSAADQAKHSLIDDYQDTIVSAAIESVKTVGIDADKVLVDGHPVIAGQTILPTLKNSSLTTVGELKSLSVVGPSNLANTTFIDNNRVGINTNNPDSALSVWDEEAAISMGKLRQDTAYIGTSRRQNFAITINRQSQLEVSADGLTTIQKLQVGKHKISHSNEEPGWLGNKGDFVINNDFKEGSPFAWICLGQYKWQALRPVV